MEFSRELDRINGLKEWLLEKMVLIRFIFLRKIVIFFLHKGKLLFECDK